MQISECLQAERSVEKDLQVGGEHGSMPGAMTEPMEIISGHCLYREGGKPDRSLRRVLLFS